jgi:HK97 gp10 family phage protein
MSNVTINLDIRKLERIARDLPGLTSNALAAVALDGEAYIKYSFGTSPSAPGDPPGVDTGKLRNSIRAEKETNTRWVITTDTEYAGHLEFGTSRMAPRPFMGPGLQYIAETAPDMFRGFLERSR